MSRSLTGAADTAIASGNVPALILIEMDFSSGFLRVNNSAVDITWNSYEWLGVGQLGSIDTIKEGAGLEAHGLSFRISGVPQANVAVALTQDYQGRDCRVYLAPLTAAHAVIVDPVLVWSGRLDTMDINLGKTATITVAAESRLADWDRPRVRRYNQEDQQIDYPDDLGFEFVPQMVDKQIVWGS
ncbi:MAG: hypothetical protein RLZZ524_686 [Pseudomonadota bacterium]|jgi:hypothetical protein